MICILMLESTVLCEVCRLDYPATMNELLSRVHKTEHQLKDVHLVCSSCSSVASGEPIDCESLDCPWLYERKKISAKAEALTNIHDLLDDIELEWRGDNVYDYHDIEDYGEPGDDSDIGIFVSSGSDSDTPEVIEIV